MKKCYTVVRRSAESLLKRRIGVKFKENQHAGVVRRSAESLLKQIIK